MCKRHAFVGAGEVHPAGDQTRLELAPLNSEALLSQLPKEENWGGRGSWTEGLVWKIAHTSAMSYLGVIWLEHSLSQISFFNQKTKRPLSEIVFFCSLSCFLGTKVMQAGSRTSSLWPCAEIGFTGSVPQQSFQPIVSCIVRCSRCGGRLQGSRASSFQQQILRYSDRYWLHMFSTISDFAWWRDCSKVRRKTSSPRLSTNWDKIQSLSVSSRFSRSLLFDFWIQTGSEVSIYRYLLLNPKKNGKGKLF